MENQFVQLFQIVLAAGQEIMDVYSGDIEVAFKEDQSPLTIADHRANDRIVRGLAGMDVTLPILSEEGRAIPYEERKAWDRFWLVDPLDGTKEFIKKNGEFTVNIALIEKGYPVVGIIYAPALDVLYYGEQGLGAFKLTEATKQSIMSFAAFQSKASRLAVSSDDNRSVARVVASRSHMSAETEAFIQQLEDKYDRVEVVSSGSSLKFCLVAEGSADYYPRYAPTMEWDTGAGQAIVEAAGGKVIQHNGNERFRYNKDNLTNDWFLASNE